MNNGRALYQWPQSPTNRLSERPKVTDNILMAGIYEPIYLLWKNAYYITHVERLHRSRKTQTTTFYLSTRLRVERC